MRGKILKGLCGVAILFLLLLMALISVRIWVYDNFDPYLIDYDAPGVDITSEGP